MEDTPAQLENLNAISVQLRSYVCLLIKISIYRLRGIMGFWLMKTEPSTFGIDDLIKCENKVEPWDGVRNYQARNMMRDQMQIGDLAFFYHSNCKEPAIVGIVKICSKSYPDPTQYDPDSKYFDPKSTSDNPRWYLVDVHFQKKFTQPLSLSFLKSHVALQGMQLLKKGNRLSITPVSAKHWDYIVDMSVSA